MIAGNHRTRIVLVAILLLFVSDAWPQLNFDPPRIVVSNRPLALMLIDGPPSTVPIQGTRLEFVVNTDQDVFRDRVNGTWYLLRDGHWLKNSMLASGDWISTSDLPADFLTLQVNSDWPQVAAAMPASMPDAPPLPLIISYEPTELVLIDGESKLEPITGTGLQFVSNTSSELFITRTVTISCFPDVGSAPKTSSASGMPSGTCLPRSLPFQRITERRWSWQPFRAHPRPNRPWQRPQSRNVR